MCVFVAILVGCVLIPGQRVSAAYWAPGHHVISVLAFELLEPSERQEILRLLQNHPRFSNDFKAPESILGDENAIARWQVGKAGEWSDIIRGKPDWDRPKWHYQLGATLTVGDVDVPSDPNELPEQATLESLDLHLVQAVKLCQNTLADSEQTDADRAVALCWLAHLIADAHQPCHAGSLYSTIAFDDGDRGGNGIPITNGRNLHSVWDSTLGSELTPGNVNRRVAKLLNDPALMLAGQAAIDNELEQQPEQWISESRLAAQQYVYTEEVLQNIRAVERGLVEEVRPHRLSENYLTQAGRVSQLRAVQAAHRLAYVWKFALAEAAQ